jgi:hypothetical protein
MLGFADPAPILEASLFPSSAPENCSPRRIECRRTFGPKVVKAESVFLVAAEATFSALPLLNILCVSRRVSQTVSQTACRTRSRSFAHFAETTGRSIRLASLRV